jgi:cell division protein FtsL
MKFVRSSLLVKLVVLILVVYAVVTLVSLRSQITAKETQAAALTTSIAAAEQENGRLQESIDELDTDAGVEKVARDKLGMVSNGEIVFHDVSN